MRRALAGRAFYESLSPRLTATASVKRAFRPTISQSSQNGLVYGTAPHPQTRHTSSSVRKRYAAKSPRMLDAEASASSPQRLSVRHTESHPISSFNGEGRWSASVDYQNEDAYSRLGLRPDDILQQIRGASSRPFESSLSSHLAAAIAVAENHRTISATITKSVALQQDTLSLGYDASAQATASFNLNKAAPKPHDLDVALPRLQINQEGRSNSLIPPRISVRFHVSYNARAHVGPRIAEHVTLDQEIGRFARVSGTVLQRVWNDLRFDTYESAAPMLAEAVCKVVEFSDPALALAGATVTLSVPSSDGSELSVSATVRLVGMSGDLKDSVVLVENDSILITSPGSKDAESQIMNVDRRVGKTSQTNLQHLLHHQLSSSASAATSADKASDPISASMADLDDDNTRRCDLGSASHGGSHPILIALGSNVGDRLSCIEQACQLLDADPDIRVVKTSSLYETKAMYVEDQAPFLNGICEVKTSLSPVELLNRTQAIEQSLGRVKNIAKGPRNIDLDILLHGNTMMKTERLTVPHPLMLERHFVLDPMMEVAPGMQHPETLQTFGHHSSQLKRSDGSVSTVTPLGDDLLLRLPLQSGSVTAIMSILNVTPDSFSDGGDNAVTDADQLRELVRSHIADGATVIDIGGQSSRPNAPDVTADEEIRRILPVIQAIKSLPEAAGIAISVDTYRAVVAEAAVQAGAHIVNDISAGTLDANMLSTVARLGCTYAMMHMRGTPSTMMSEENCRYPKGLVKTILAELKKRVNAAQAAGIRRWRIILDPGVGFSKTAEQNLEILANMNFHGTHSLRRFPWLVGTSRKSFIGKVTGVADPKERIWGTAATVTAAVRGGVDIVRVHDVAEMAQVVKMATATYKFESSVTA